MVKVIIVKKVISCDVLSVVMFLCFSICHFVRGGTDPPKNDKIFRKLKLTGIFRCSFIFKNRGKFWFLSKSSFDPPYMGSENFDYFR